MPKTLRLSELDRLGRTWGVSPVSLIRRMQELRSYPIRLCGVLTSVCEVPTNSKRLNRWQLIVVTCHPCCPKDNGWPRSMASVSSSWLMNSDGQLRAFAKFLAQKTPAPKCGWCPSQPSYCTARRLVPTGSAVGRFDPGLVMPRNSNTRDLMGTDMPHRTGGDDISVKS